MKFTEHKIWEKGESYTMQCLKCGFVYDKIKRLTYEKK